LHRHPSGAHCPGADPGADCRGRLRHGHAPGAGTFRSGLRRLRAVREPLVLDADRPDRADAGMARIPGPPQAPPGTIRSVTTMRKFNTDLISGVVALGIATIFGLAREPWTPLSSRWPNTILVFIIICGAFLLVRAFIKPERAALFDEGSRVRMVVSVVLLLLWASLIK